MDLNCEELKKEWEEAFYESEWKPDTLKCTKTEEDIISELKALLPRHMPVYDWNLPYAEEILLIFRRHVNAQLCQAVQDSKPEKYKNGDFCISINCESLHDDNKSCSECKAYKFHDYLKKNGFEIVKKT